MKKIFAGIWHYLKDWKNLLGHTLLGVGIIVVSAVLPIPVWARILVFIVLVTFNVFRERLFAKLKTKRNQPSTEEE